MVKTETFLFLALATGAWAQPAAAPAAVSLDDVRRALSRAETVSTRFVQERHLALFSEPLRTEGWLCFARPGRVRWEIVQPYQSILVSDGSEVAQFERVDHRWKKLELGLAGAMQQVIGQIAAVIDGRYAADSREHFVSLTNTAAGPVITLVPRSDKLRKVMRAIEVQLSPDLQQTRAVTLREADGDFTEIRFSEQLVGVLFPDRTFDCRAPAEWESIRAARGAGPAPTP